jgi:hypothetical protein
MSQYLRSSIQVEKNKGMGETKKFDRQARYKNNRNQRWQEARDPRDGSLEKSPSPNLKDYQRFLERESPKWYRTNPQNRLFDKSVGILRNEDIDNGTLVIQICNSGLVHDSAHAP